MTRDEIQEISKIVKEDDVYRHFVRRINKEFELADEERNSNVYVLFEEKEGKKVGFCVIGHSPAKMKTWGKIFSEEGWVPEDFKMKIPSFELMYMYIRPEVRDKGYGGLLFKKAMEFTKDKGVETIYAYVSDRTDAALSFYKSLKAKIIKDLSDEGITSAFLMWQV